MGDAPIFKLPVELRLEIFEYVLYSPHETGELEWNDKGPRLPQWMVADNRRALTTVCRQFRADMFARFYHCTKVKFAPLILDKFQSGFFVTNNEFSTQMIWDYLGSPRNWAMELSTWLDHLGEDITNKIKTIDIHVGIWDRKWRSDENPLMIWLAAALAEIVVLLQGSATQVNLCFVWEMRDWGWILRRREADRMSLPISEMCSAMESLIGTVKEHESEIRYEDWAYLRRKREKSLSKCDYLLRTFLARVERGVKERSSYGSVQTDSVEACPANYVYMAPPPSTESLASPSSALEPI